MENAQVYREFSTSADTKKWGTEFYGEWAKTYSENERCLKNFINSCIAAPIECYCGYSYRDINPLLRKGDALDGVYRRMADMLANALVNAPRVPEDIVVYRLVPQVVIDQIKHDSNAGTLTVEHGFISTGMLLDIFKSNEPFGGNPCSLKLRVKKGTVGAYVSSIPSIDREEEEMIFFPDGYYKLVEKHPERIKGKLVYDCELVYF